MKPILSRLIDRGGTLLRTDLRYSLSGGFFLSTMNMSGAILSLVLTIAFANLISIDAYGVYRYVLAVYAIFAIASLPGVDVALTQAISLGRDGSYSAGLQMKVRWALLGSITSIGYAAYLYATDQVVMASLFVIAGLALPMMESCALYSAALNGKKQFKTWAAFDVASQVLSAITLISVMIITKNIIAVMLAYFMPYIAVRAAGSWWVMQRSLENNDSDAGLAKYARSVTAFQILARVSTSIDQIVLYQFLGPAQVAIYSLAMAIPNRVQGILKISGILALPKFAGREGAEIAASLPRKMAIFGIVILIACVSYVVIAPFIFTYLFPQYAESLLYSQVAIFFTLSALTYPFSSFLFAHKKMGENYLVSIGSFAAKIGCLIILVPLYGIWGAVAGVLASAAATTIIATGLLWRERIKR